MARLIDFVPDTDTLLALDGGTRYWLPAMQVSALGDYISAMRVAPLGRFLREVYEGKHVDEPTCEGPAP